MMIDFAKKSIMQCVIQSGLIQKTKYTKLVSVLRISTFQSQLFFNQFILLDFVEFYCDQQNAGEMKMNEKFQSTKLHRMYIEYII